jgi:primosomal protein N' (replication factor Y)
MTLHSDNFTLVCHTCGHTEKVPTSCPECQHTNIIHKGFGTKLLEAELHKIFKDARIARFDSDNNRDETLNANYDDVKNGNVDIIIGTQTIARGLDLQNLATVGVVQADAGLSLPDYSAEERTFHLLTQVLGRVGRGHLEHDNAIIQTYQPDHPAITAALSADYDSFYQNLIKKRKKAHLPPYEYIALLYLTYKTESVVLKKIKAVATSLKNQADVTVSTPMPAFHERERSGYTWQIIIKAKSRKDLTTIFDQLPKSSYLHYDFDPYTLL